MPDPTDTVKLTVNLTARAYQALNRTAEITGHTRTDSVNRALHVYEQVCTAVLDGRTQQLTVIDSDGVAFQLIVPGRQEPGRWTRWLRRCLHGGGQHKSRHPFG